MLDPNKSSCSQGLGIGGLETSCTMYGLGLQAWTLRRGFRGLTLHSRVRGLGLGRVAA